LYTIYKTLHTFKNILKQNKIYILRKERLTNFVNPIGLITPYIDRRFFLLTMGEKSKTPLIAE